MATNSSTNAYIQELFFPRYHKHKQSKLSQLMPHNGWLKESVGLIVIPAIVGGVIGFMWLKLKVCALTQFNVHPLI